MCNIYIYSGDKCFPLVECLLSLAGAVMSARGLTSVHHDGSSSSSSSRSRVELKQNHLESLENIRQPVVLTDQEIAQVSCQQSCCHQKAKSEREKKKEKKRKKSEWISQH